jgi:hypothetical protein
MTDTTGLHRPEVPPNANSSRSWPPTSSRCSNHAMTALPSKRPPSRKISTQHVPRRGPRALIVDPDQAAAFEAAFGSSAGWRNGKVRFVDGAVRAAYADAIPSRRHDTVVSRLATPLGIEIHDRVLSRPCRPVRPAVDAAGKISGAPGIHGHGVGWPSFILRRSSQRRGAYGADSPSGATAEPMSPRPGPLKPPGAAYPTGESQPNPRALRRPDRTAVVGPSESSG